MNAYHDPELDDVLQDDELRRVASLLHTARAPEPPLDDAYRTGLRRQLMQEAWSMAEGRTGGWWRRLFAPPGLAWAGAVAGVLLIAAVGVWTATQQNGTIGPPIVASTLDGKNNVALQQPILVSFNQPMDHQSTEAAVQITPATSVVYAWDAKSLQLSVTPVSGNLAPNTQYQVTIGPGAKTASNQALTAPQTITFVTQPPAATPIPSPPARPTPANPLAEKQITTLNGASSLAAQWAADSSSIYYEDGTGSLLVVPAKGGSANVIASGASSFAISPAGDRLAWIESGKIEVLTFASGMNTTLTPAPAPTVVGWATDKLIWATKDGVYEQTGDGQTELTPLPAGGASVVSISPDGTHAIFTQNNTLNLLDLSTGRNTPVGGITFEGWSPDGTELLSATADSVIVSDVHGVTQATLPAGDATWSSNDAILLGGDTTIYQVRPDGSNLTPLANGTYHSPLWAPDGSTFAFVRGDGLWVATAPALPPEPTVLDEASGVVKKFMEARLAGKPDEATALLDDSGKKAYATGGLNLLIGGDPRFSRYYVLTQEATGTQPDTVRVVVRLVLSHNKKDVSSFEETLTLVRDATSKQFLIDQATAGAQRELGNGPQVVSVDVSSTAIQVTFDSDLDPATVNGGVNVVDSKGTVVVATVTYANKVVTITGVDLTAGKQYRLVVQNTVRDVQGHNVAPEYDLDLFGPVAKKHAEQKISGGSAGSPSPVASPTASAG